MRIVTVLVVVLVALVAAVSWLANGGPTTPSTAPVGSAQDVSASPLEPRVEVSEREPVDGPDVLRLELRGLPDVRQDWISAVLLRAAPAELLASFGDTSPGSTGLAADQLAALAAGAVESRTATSAGGECALSFRDVDGARWFVVRGQVAVGDDCYSLGPRWIEVANPVTTVDFSASSRVSIAPTGIPRPEDYDLRVSAGTAGTVVPLALARVFHLVDVPPGRVSFAASHAGAPSFVMPLVDPASRTEFEVETGSRFHLSLVPKYPWTPLEVVDADGSVVQSAWGLRPRSLGNGAVRHVDFSSGLIDAVGTDSIWVGAGARYPFEEPVAGLVADDDGVVRVRLQEKNTGSIEVRAATPSSELTWELAARAEGSKRFEMAQWGRQADFADGRWSLTDLAPGGYRLEWWTKDDRFARAEVPHSVNVLPGEVTAVVVELPRRRRYRVDLVADGVAGWGNHTVFVDHRFCKDVGGHYETEVWSTSPTSAHVDAGGVIGRIACEIIQHDPASARVALRPVARMRRVDLSATPTDYRFEYFRVVRWNSGLMAQARRVQPDADRAVVCPSNFCGTLVARDRKHKGVVATWRIEMGQADLRLEAGSRTIQVVRLQSGPSCEVQVELDVDGVLHRDRVGTLTGASTQLAVPTGVDLVFTAGNTSCRVRANDLEDRIVLDL